MFHVIKILFNLNYQENKNRTILSRDFQNFGNETLFFADHEDVKISPLTGWLQNYGS